MSFWMDFEGLKTYPIGRLIFCLAGFNFCVLFAPKSDKTYTGDF